MLFNNRFEVTRFSKSKITDFVILYSKVFPSGRKISEKDVLKQYGDEDQYTAYIAYDRGKPIAFYGVLPFDFLINGSIIKIAQSINTMVHPAYRKQNLFYQLAQLTNELAKNLDIKFIFGWPNSPKLFNKVLEWDFLGEMQKYTFKVPTLPFAKIAWKIKIFRKIYHRYFSLISRMAQISIYKNLEFKSTVDNDLYIPRNKEYLIYKLNCGAILLKYHDIKVLVNADYRLKIGDIEANNIQEFDIVLKKLRKLAFWSGINEINFSVDKMSNWNDILKNKYHSHDDLHLMYYTLDDNLKLKCAHFTLGDYDTF